MYVLCTLLAFLPSPTGFLRVLLLLLALVFFIPGGMLVFYGLKENNRKTLRQLRIVSILSLGLTLAALVGNFLTVLASDAVGTALYVLLVLVSTPMVCSSLWILSLFLWACLLMATFLKQKN
jgi:hypothetical protein